MNEQINIVWFKRDLRFTDHEPLLLAQQSQIPTLLIYFFEPSMLSYDDSDSRHWRFVYESLQEMNEKLVSLEAKIYIFHSEIIPIFELIASNYVIKNLYSHQEIGNKTSFDRDLEVKLFCQKNQLIGKNRKQMEWLEN